jgi:hypothetical protein
MKDYKELFSDVFVKCPTCQDDYCHPTDTTVIMGDKTITIAKEGIRSDPTGETSLRGVVITVTFVCENGGHQFFENYAFHKGKTYKSVEIGATNKFLPSVIWRD